MNALPQERPDSRFVVGLLAGAVVGAGLAMWLAPRAAAELRERLADAAKSLSKRASNQYQQASTRVGDTVGELTRKGQAVRDHAADAVVRGAQKVERYATAAKSDPHTGARKQAAAIVG